MKKFIFVSIYLIVLSLCTLVILEIVFPFTINMFPLKLHPILGKGVNILGQTSKNSVIPKDYIAIVGDSYALGLGDWMREQAEKSFFSSPPFQSTHILYKKTGKDVVTFGQMSSGSIPSVVKAITNFEYINSLWAFQLDKPKRILVYFYEGNDIYDNLDDLFFRFDKNGYDREKFYNEVYFKNFINEAFLKQEPLFQKTGLLENFLFSKALISALELNWDYLKKKFDFYKKVVSVPPKIGGKHLVLQDMMHLRKKTIDHNQISIGENEIQLPIHIQGPPFVGESISDKNRNIKKEYFDMAVYIFEQSVLFLKDYFKEVPIVIVYIPSPLSIYSIKSPFVFFQHEMMLNKHTLMKSELIPLKSQEICVSIENISKKHDFGFLDSRNYLRNAVAKGKLVHGPKDWTHFNKNGYEALSEGILETSFYETKPGKRFGCKNSY